MEKELERLLQKNGCNQRLQSLGLANTIDTTPNDTDRIRKNPVKKKHILDNDEHDWHLVGATTWDQTVDIIDDVMKAGTEGKTKTGDTVKYKYYGKHLVVTKYREKNDERKIGTAFVSKPENETEYTNKSNK